MFLRWKDELNINMILKWQVSMRIVYCYVAETKRICFACWLSNAARVFCQEDLYHQHVGIKVWYFWRLFFEHILLHGITII